jgi:carboxypeptidase Q
MKRDGLENVHIEPVMVPKWVRGRERADIIQPGQHALAMLGLGDSVGTPPEGVEAEVLVVQSFAELDAKSALAKGRIVFFNVPFTNYGDSRLFRMSGLARAARHGAVAALIRSIGPTGLRLPHGCAAWGRRPQIPAAAVAARMRICSAWPAGATG